MEGDPWIEHDGGDEMRYVVNPPLNDGTPRREKGVRAFLGLISDQSGKRVYLQSPILKDIETAYRWAAFIGDLVAEGVQPADATRGWDAFAKRWGVRNGWV